MEWYGYLLKPFGMLAIFGGLCFIRYLFIWFFPSGWLKRVLLTDTWQEGWTKELGRKQPTHRG
jgi:hypothetical protein